MSCYILLCTQTTVNLYTDPVHECIVFLYNTQVFKPFMQQLHLAVEQLHLHQAHFLQRILKMLTGSSQDGQAA